MDDHIEFDEVVMKVQELYLDNKPRMKCSECGKKFYAIYSDPETGNLQILWEDYNYHPVYYCIDHLYYDLLLDPGKFEYVPITLKYGELVLVDHKRAKLFLNDRRN